jgi:hypothetical protein
MLTVLAVIALVVLFVTLVVAGFYYLTSDYLFSALMAVECFEAAFAIVVAILQALSGG